MGRLPRLEPHVRPVDAGLTHLAIKIARGEQGAASDVFSQMARAPTWAVTAFLHWAAVAAGFLLIVPGVLLSQRLQFAEQFAVARDLGPLEALEASWRVTRMQGWGLFKIGLFEEWNFANRTTLFRRGVDAHGAREVEAAVLYLVYEARLFGDGVDAPAEPLVAPSPAEAAASAVPAAPAVAAVLAADATTIATVAATAPDAASPAGTLTPAFPCPRCGAVAAERRAGESSVFPCVTCGGVWVDNAVAQKLVRANEPKAVAAAEEVARFAVRPVSTRPALACPACQVALQRVVVAAIELDVCATHGTWFDRDELPRVVRALGQPPERIVVRTAPNTITENLANAGRVAAEHLASSGHTFLDNFLDAIANVRISSSDSAWADRDSGDSHQGGWFDGAWGGSNDSSDQSVQTGSNDSSWSDSGCCPDNNDNGSCSDNDNSSSCGDNDGGHRD